MRRRLLPLVAVALVTGCSWRGLAYEQRIAQVQASAADAAATLAQSTVRGLCSDDATCAVTLSARSGHLVVAPADRSVLQLVAGDAGLAPDSVRLDLARSRVAGDASRVLLRSGLPVTVSGAAPGPLVAGAASTTGTVGTDPVLTWTASDGVGWQAFFAPGTTADVVAAVAADLTEQGTAGGSPQVAPSPALLPTVRCPVAPACGARQTGGVATAVPVLAPALVGGSYPQTVLAAVRPVGLVQYEQLPTITGTALLSSELGAGAEVDVTVPRTDEAVAYRLGPEQVVLFRRGRTQFRVAVAGGTRDEVVALAVQLAR